MASAVVERKEKKTNRPDGEFTVSLKDAAKLVGVNRVTMMRKLHVAEVRRWGDGETSPCFFHPDDIRELVRMYGAGRGPTRRPSGRGTASR